VPKLSTGMRMPPNCLCSMKFFGKGRDSEAAAGGGADCDVTGECGVVGAVVGDPEDWVRFKIHSQSETA